MGTGTAWTTSKRVGAALWFTKAGPAPQMCPHPHRPPAPFPLIQPLPSEFTQVLRASPGQRFSFPLHGPILLRAGDWAGGVCHPYPLKSYEESWGNRSTECLMCHITGPAPGTFMHTASSLTLHLWAIHFDAMHFEFPLGMWDGLREVN